MMVAIILIAGCLQTLAIILITQNYKNYFNGKAFTYAKSIARLAKDHPIPGNFLRLCYAAFIAEIVLFVIFK
jgi:hypothetical protein